MSGQDWAPADVYFGEAGKAPPDWRKAASESDRDDDAPPSEEERAAVARLLGFDPAEADEGHKSALPALLKQLRQRLKGFDPNEPRDDSGEWTGGGGGDAHPAVSRLGKIARALAALPAAVAGKAKAIYERSRAKLKATRLGAFMVKRYGEANADRIITAIALSGPVPLPGSQPLTIALSFAVAEGVRAWHKVRGTLKGAAEMADAEVEGAARAWLRSVEADLSASAGSAD